MGSVAEAIHFPFANYHFSSVIAADDALRLSNDSDKSKQANGK